MGSTSVEATELDIIVIGAGISGINTAYRLLTELPNRTFTIFEARDVIGGTWDLFRYPGIRSDAELYTFGFHWNPWTGDKSISDGPSIISYLKESVNKFGIDKKIRFHHKVLAVDWSSKERKWTLTVNANGSRQIFKAAFVFWGTGYYSYEQGLQTKIPGLENFKGDVLHPQFWPEDYDYSNKKVVVIGSGATAITLVPAMAPVAQSVTMLQRTPGYILPINSNAEGGWLRKIMPSLVVHNILRWQHIMIGFLFFRFCKYFPGAATKIIRMYTESVLPPTIPHDPHFNPPYKPFEQRFCFAPEGDFFASLRSGKAHVVTDTIQTVTETGIQTTSGQFLEADLIITATGLKILVGGGAKITIDGTPFNFGDKFLWNGTMLQDLPNSAYLIGYINVAWTLGADASARLICRLLKHMEKNHLVTATPRLDPNHSMKTFPAFNLAATYIKAATEVIPKAGDAAPWSQRNNALKDTIYSSWGSVTNNIEFEGEEGSNKKTI